MPDVSESFAKEAAQKGNDAVMSLDPPKKSRAIASPLARSIATRKGIDLADLTGTGPNGRIVKVDVLSAGPRPQAPNQQSLYTSTPVAVFAPASSDLDSIRRIYADRAFEEIAIDSMRKTIAARLTEAKRTIPHFFLRTDINFDKLLALRSEMNVQLEPREAKLSVNDFVIKASARALEQVPDCNAVWAGDRILKFLASDIAVAVAIEGGLLTPVLRDAETKTLLAISAEMKDLAARARNGKLAPSEYEGGSFAISNLGMLGIDSFDALINPPHAATLAVGAAVRKPVICDAGSIKAGTITSVTLSVDHRVIDGALGASFIKSLKHNLENPTSLLA